MGEIKSPEQNEIKKIENTSEVKKEQQETENSIKNLISEKSSEFENKNETSDSGSNKNEIENGADVKDLPEKRSPIQNKIDGLKREEEVREELEEKYPEKNGHDIVSEAYLRDKDGHIVKDKETGEARRIDFVVIKDGKVVDSVEVTSKTADKTEQCAKENRIRENGGNYIKDNNGDLVKIQKGMHTRIERKD